MDGSNETVPGTSWKASLEQALARVGKHSAVALAVSVAVVGSYHVHAVSVARAQIPALSELMDRQAWALSVGVRLSATVDAFAGGDQALLAKTLADSNGSVGGYTRCDLRETGMFAFLGEAYCPGESVEWRTRRSGPNVVVVVGPMKGNVANAALRIVSPNPGAKVSVKPLDAAKDDVDDGVWTDLRAHRDDPIPRFANGQHLAFRIQSPETER